MLKVVNEGHMAKGEHGFSDVRSESNFAARKFYSQRNVYLTGFTLFLSLLVDASLFDIYSLIDFLEFFHVYLVSFWISLIPKKNLDQLKFSPLYYFMYVSYL